jgi:hypothetical protein
MDVRERFEGIVLIHRPTEEYLNSRQRVAYRSHREKLVRSLAEQTKDPEKLKRCAKDISRVDRRRRGVYVEPLAQNNVGVRRDAVDRMR